jgi:hypothetical protein
MIIFDKDSYEYVFGNLIKSIKNSLPKSNNDSVIATLILIYATIDIVSKLAFLNNSNMNAVNKRYKGWVKKYLLPNLDAECTANDIYSARCAVIHSHTTESDLVQRKEAKEILYSWGGASIANLKAVGDEIKDYKERFRYLHVDSLIEALETGLNQFKDVASTHSQNQIDAYNKHLYKFYKPLKKEKVDIALSLINLTSVGG